MTSNFRHVALIGKYQATAAGAMTDSSRRALEEIAQFLVRQGCQVVLEQETAINTNLTAYPSMDVDTIGTHCDLGLVVGGDGQLRFARSSAIAFSPNGAPCASALPSFSPANLPILVWHIMIVGFVLFLAFMIA